ncbi:MAG: hypothetical protein ACK2UT_18140, partial [Candidatus Promineifilaceae bacterium]
AQKMTRSAETVMALPHHYTMPDHTTCWFEKFNVNLAQITIVGNLFLLRQTCRLIAAIMFQVSCWPQSLGKQRKATKKTRKNGGILS